MVPSVSLTRYMGVRSDTCAAHSNAASPPIEWEHGRHSLRGIGSLHHSRKYEYFEYEQI